MLARLHSLFISHVMTAERRGRRDFPTYGRISDISRFIAYFSLDNYAESLSHIHSANFKFVLPHEFTLDTIVKSRFINFCLRVSSLDRLSDG